MVSSGARDIVGNVMFDVVLRNYGKDLRDGARRRRLQEENSICRREAWVRTGMRHLVWQEYGQGLGSRRTKG